MTRRGPLVALLLAAACVSCVSSTSSDHPATEIAAGTWGGDGAAAVVSDSTVHVHIGCTKGDFPRPATLDANGRFEVSGRYVLRAFPVEIGPSLPARFAGVVRGRQLLLSVAVDDTVMHTLVAVGPATVTLGREPKLGPCPICVARADER